PIARRRTGDLELPPAPRRDGQDHQGQVCPNQSTTIARVRAFPRIKTSNSRSITCFFCPVSATEMRLYPPTQRLKKCLPGPQMNTLRRLLSLVALTLKHQSART